MRSKLYGSTALGYLQPRSFPARYPGAGVKGVVIKRLIYHSPLRRFAKVELLFIASDAARVR